MEPMILEDDDPTIKESIMETAEKVPADNADTQEQRNTLVASHREAMPERKEFRNEKLKKQDSTKTRERSVPKVPLRRSKRLQQRKGKLTYAAALCQNVH